MAKKNEILLSIALEGDAEIKSKLAAVGETGKRSLADIEKNVGQAGSRLEKLAKPLEGVREGLAPLLEQAGLARLGGLFGGSGGLLSGLSGAAGPAALGTVLSGIALHLAKVREESEKTEARLKALGGGSKAVDALNESARKLGVSPSQLQGGFENFLDANRRQRAEDDARRGVSHPPGYVPPENEAPLPRVFQGGKQVFGPAATVDEFAATQRALLAGARVDKTKPEDAKQAVDQLLGSIFQQHDIGQNQTAPGLTSDAVRAFEKTSPSAANLLARALGGTVGRGFGNAEELASFLDRRDSRGRIEPIPPNQFFGAVAKEEPQALKDAQAARGVSDAFEGLKANVERLDKSFGDTAGKQINKSLTDQIDQFSGGISKATDLINRNGASIEKGSEIGRAIGDKTPIPFAGAIGSTLGSITGGTIGVGGDLLGQAIRSNGITDFLGKALLNPAAIPGNVPEQTGASQLTPESLARTRIPSPLDSVSPKALLGPEPVTPRLQELPSGFIPDRTLDGWSVAPPRPEIPPTPEQTQPVQPPQQFGQADGTQLASLGTALQDVLRGLVQGLTDKANSLGPQPDNKVQGPVDGLGVRGEGETSPQTNLPSDVAEAGGALKEFASAVYDAAKSIQAAAAGAGQTAGGGAETQKVAAAGGGMIRHLDNGGHLSGPGTSTSDSIPAMLSDGEYVIKASSARRIGRARLDRLNASGSFAEGGFVKKLWRKFRRGGYVEDTAVNTAYGFEMPSDEVYTYGRGDGSVYSGFVHARAHLGPGTHDITPTDDGGAIIDGAPYPPGHPLLDDPIVKQAIQRSLSEAGGQGSSKSKYKSDFVGTFGSHAEGGVIGHFAAGGAVGNLAAFSGMKAHFPHFAEGGLFDVPSLSGPAPDVGNLAAGGSPWDNVPHLGSMDLRTNHGDVRAVGPEETLRNMRSAARDAANASAGQAPSWEYGR
ncbi:hypothetical protein ACFQZO_24385 [Bradyrhizobium sp. GCM10027634]|uniref:hypothetical protein n=1 Tax=unclassified Bradyrhizobium TaxID=2631580 RepID=UPI00263ACD49|nr:hypothetical protein [Bradyrhizobium sp. WYCCWR 12677]MDN5003980.1 hypothetical protein [Bradyrhizobium sp. WYCCWR 12677]